MAGRAADGAAACCARARSGTYGRFALVASDAPLAESSLYVVARGGTPTAGKGGQTITDNGPLPRKRMEPVCCPRS
jgi:hypothetical protein